MNDRIKLLAEQARKYAWENETHWSADAERATLFEQKFAELIVKECMSMYDELKVEYFNHRKNTMDFGEKHIYAEGEAACDVLKYKMKKHFGVEE